MYRFIPFFLLLLIFSGTITAQPDTDPLSDSRILSIPLLRPTPLLQARVSYPYEVWMDISFDSISRPVMVRAGRRDLSKPGIPSYPLPGGPGDASGDTVLMTALEQASQAIRRSNHRLLNPRPAENGHVVYRVYCKPIFLTVAPAAAPPLPLQQRLAAEFDRIAFAPEQQAWLSTPFTLHVTIAVDSFGNPTLRDIARWDNWAFDRAMVDSDNIDSALNLSEAGAQYTALWDSFSMAIARLAPFPDNKANGIHFTYTATPLSSGYPSRQIPPSATGHDALLAAFKKAEISRKWPLIGIRIAVDTLGNPTLGESWLPQANSLDQLKFTRSDAPDSIAALLQRVKPFRVETHVQDRTKKVAYTCILYLNKKPLPADNRQQLPSPQDTSYDAYDGRWNTTTSSGRVLKHFSVGSRDELVLKKPGREVFAGINGAFLTPDILPGFGIAGGLRVPLTRTISIGGFGMYYLMPKERLMGILGGQVMVHLSPVWALEGSAGWMPLSGPTSWLTEKGATITPPTPAGRAYGLILHHSMTPDYGIVTQSQGRTRFSQVFLTWSAGVRYLEVPAQQASGLLLEAGVGFRIRYHGVKTFGTWEREGQFDRIL